MKIGDKLKQLRVGRCVQKNTIADAMDISVETYELLEESRRILDVEDLRRVCNFYNVELNTILQYQRDYDPLLLNNKTVSVCEYLKERMDRKALEDIVHYLLYFIDFNYFHKYEDMMMGNLYRRGGICNRTKKIVEPESFSYENIYDEDFGKGDDDDDPEAPLYNQDIEIINGVIDFFDTKSLKEIREYTAKDAPIVRADEAKRCYVYYEDVFERSPIEKRERPHCFDMYKLLQDSNY